MNSKSQENNVDISEYRQNLELLQKIPFFAAFSIEFLKVLAYLCVRVELLPDETVYHQGDDNTLSYYIISGSVVLHLRRPDNDEGEFRHYGSGDFFNGLALLGPRPSLFTVTAQTRVNALTLSRERFNKALGQFPQMIDIIMQTILKELQQWDIRLIEEQLANGKEIKSSTCLGITLL